MSLGMAPEPEPELEKAELELAAAYGIEGLRRCIDTQDFDEWLDLFDVILEEMDKPLNRGQRSFPVKKAVFPDPEKREEVIQGFEEISDIANRAKGSELEERSEMQDELSEAIDMAEELFRKIEEIPE